MLYCFRDLSDTTVVLKQDVIAGISAVYTISTSTIPGIARIAEAICGEIR